MKIYKSYNNQLLLDALKPKQQVFKDLQELTNPNTFDDSQLKTIHIYLNKCTDFERDLLYLVSQYNIVEVSKLYGVSRTHIYTMLKKIRKKLCTQS